MEERWGMRLAQLLRELRLARGISQRQLAFHAEVHPSVVSRAERAQDAKISTWDKLFDGLGYILEFNPVEMSEGVAALYEDEADRRAERRREGLCAGKRRFY